MGSGVVQFTTVEESETAIAKFQGYIYGGRPLGERRLQAINLKLPLSNTCNTVHLDVRFNDRWHEFTSTAAAGTHLQNGQSTAVAVAAPAVA